MKNVLIVMSTNVFYGAERTLLEFLKDNREHRFFIYTSNIADDLFDAVKAENIQIFSSSSMRVRSIRRKPVTAVLYIVYNLFVIHRMVRQYHIDVVYGNNTIDMVYVMLYRRFFNSCVGTICHIHDIIRRSMYHKLLRRFGKYIDAFITPSHAGKQSFVNDIGSPDKVHVVYNGCSVFGPHDVQRVRTKKVLLFVGLISKLKRIDLFIQILDQLNTDYPKQYQGIIVGSMSENDPVYIAAVKAQLNQSDITYFGHVKHEQLCSEIFPQADALILTSDRDTLPTVVLEAMASNVLVCARAVDGVPEMIQNGVNGVLWDYDAPVETMAAAVHAALSNEGKAKELQENALKTIKEKFNPDKKKEFVNILIEGIPI